MGLIRILILGVVAVLVYSLYKRIFAGPSRGAGESPQDERLGRLVQDPQCLVYVDSKDAVHRKVRGGDLFFCSEKCAEEFMEAARKEG